MADRGQCAAFRWVPPAALDLEFPESLDVAAEIVYDEWGVDDCIMCLTAKMESLGAPTPYPDLVATHRLLYWRVLVESPQTPV